MTSPLLRSAKHVSKLAAFSARRRERLTQSFRVFLLGLVIACGIEVAVDWHATLSEVRALRERMRDRGTSYLAVLDRSLAEAVAERDALAIERLVNGVFDDRDAIFVRITDAGASTLFERLDPSFARAFERDRDRSFADYYAHQLERDARGILEDPALLRRRMIESRHRDLPQAYQDLLTFLHLAKPPPRRTRSRQTILFQDRLYTTNKRGHDDAVTYAIGRIEEHGRPVGVAIVAFDMSDTNAMIRGKYLKGAGLLLFFLLLILLQNVASRREKLRLFDLESKYARAKAAIASSLPAPLETDCVRIAGAMTQSVGSVDGMLWDVALLDREVEIVVLDPEGDGVEAAAVALHLHATYRHRRELSTVATIHEELVALGDAARRIPGKRDVGIAIVRIAEDGSFRGLRCGMGAIRILADGGARAIEEAGTDVQAPPGVVGPVQAYDGRVGDGELMLIATDGLGGAVRRLQPDAIASFVGRARTKSSDLSSLTNDAATWARGKSSDIAQDDIVVIGVERVSHPVTR